MNSAALSVCLGCTGTKVYNVRGHPKTYSESDADHYIPTEDIRLNQHRSGIFGKKVSMSNMLAWSKVTTVSQDQPRLTESGDLSHCNQDLHPPINNSVCVCVGAGIYACVINSSVCVHVRARVCEG